MVAGIILMFAEIIIPGLVVIFLGAAALLVGLGIHWGLIDGGLDAFTWWFISSLSLIVLLRGVILHFLPGDFSYSPANDDVDAFGELALVVEEISIHHERGRISFHGSTWPASCGVKRIAAGVMVRIISRDNIRWIVEPLEEGSTQFLPITRHNPFAEEE